MFYTVYSSILGFYNSIKQLNENGYNAAISGGAYIAIAYLTLVVYVSIYLVAYLLMAFGLKQALITHNKPVTKKIWIPVLQYLVIIDLIKADSITKMSKKTFSIVIITLCLVSHLSSFIFDLIYYASAVIKVLIPLKDIVIDVSIKGENQTIIVLNNLLDFALSIFIFLMMKDYLFTRTRKHIFCSVVCLIFSTLFPSIFVFSTRKVKSVSGTTYYKVYTNPYNNPNNNQNRTYNSQYGRQDDNGPFSDFSSKTNSPFSEFESGSETGKTQQKSAQQFVDEMQNNDKGNSESDSDDMF